ncbi:hypothetical protein AcV5_001470 [Taiwanofungus camphoratus]|nr:hypothetical protein AcV5_001470 [Antrodia cinnamomea]
MLLGTIHGIHYLFSDIRRRLSMLQRPQWVAGYKVELHANQRARTKQDRSDTTRPASYWRAHDVLPLHLSSFVDGALLHGFYSARGWIFSSSFISFNRSD